MFYLYLLFSVYIILAPLASEAVVSTCLSDQYLRALDLTCRNCSDLDQIFLGYQDWIGREVTNDLRRQDENKNMLPLLFDRDGIEEEGEARYQPNSLRLPQQQQPSLTKRQQQRGQKQIFKDGPSKELLSRLISATDAGDGGESSSHADQDFIDSGTTNQDQTSDTGLLEDESGFIGDTSGNPVTGDDVFSVQLASKRTRKLIHRLVSSSPLIGSELLQAVDQCKQNQNISACQMWSNFCVLTMYSHSDPATANSHLRRGNEGSYLARQEDVETVTGKRSRMQTWQQCRQFTSESICNSWRDWFRFERKSSQDAASIFAQADEQLVTKLGSSGPLLRLNQAVKLLAYKYSLDGKFIGVDQFGLSELSKFCPLGIGNFLGDKASSSDSVRFGKNMQLRCRFDRSLLTSGLIKQLNETLFIDLYLAYQQNGAMFVKPVPILVKNLMFDGWQINRRHSRDPSRWKLVHRFFFHALTKLGKDEQDDEIAMYARSVALDFKFKKQDKGALMSQLLLTLDYDISVTSKHLQNNATQTSADLRNQQQHLSEATDHNGGGLITEIVIVQTLVDMLSYKKDLDLAITILAILSSVWSLIKCYNVQKCYGLVKLDLDSLVKFLLIASDTIGNLLAMVTFALLTFLFVTLKFQSQVQILAPSEELSEALIFNLQLALLLKFIGLLYKLYTLLTVDIFFVDWERPKMLTTSEMVNHHASYTYASKADPGAIKEQTDLRFQLAGTAQQSASFWRPYTIINKWLQMQTLRRQNLTLQLMAFVCLVDYFQITKLATEDTDFAMMNKPSNSIDEPSATIMMNFPELTSTINRSFRILILACIYLLLSLGQLIYKKYLHEPFIKSSVHEFVDLCSVANVSLFAMLHPRFGYYIHGRNANGTGDCGIAEMNALLEREERDLCTKRGLAPNSDQQTFLLVLPKIINDHYRKLLFGNEILAGNGGFQQKSAFTSDMLPFSQSTAGKGFNGLRSAMNLTFASKSSFSSNRALIETIVAKNKAVNLFLTNFLEHIYKDIDYSIRERRRFESLLWDVDFDEESFVGSTVSGGGSAAANSRNIGGPFASMGQYNGGEKASAATFCVDNNYTFTSLLLFGLELDLTLFELLSLISLDLWLGEPPLVITAALVWLLHNGFRTIYVSCARHNLVTKAALDEKFLFKG